MHVREDADVTDLVLRQRVRRYGQRYGLTVSDDRDRRELVQSIRVALADVAVPKDVFVTTPSLAARYGDVIGTLVEPALREGVTIYARP